MVGNIGARAAGLDGDIDSPEHLIKAIITQFAELQASHAPGARSVKAFCRWASIGKTTFYAEVNAGRLRAIKVGGKTLVTHEDGREWLANRARGIEASGAYRERALRRKSAASAKSPEAAPLGDGPVKRGRGRPRKLSLVEANAP
jgi:hypothetical protein